MGSSLENQNIEELAQSIFTLRSNEIEDEHSIKASEVVQSLLHTLFSNENHHWDAATKALKITRGSQKLYVPLSQYAQTKWSDLDLTEGAFVLDFIDQGATLYFAPAAESEARRIANFSPMRLSEMASLSGGFMGFVYPEHYSIVCKTIAFSFEDDLKAPLFAVPKSGRTNPSKTEKHSLEIVDRLAGAHTKLLNLNELNDELRQFGQDCPTSNPTTVGGFVYQPFSPNRSSLFDYGRPNSNKDRGDVATSYRIGVSNGYHRDFFLAPTDLNSMPAHSRSAAFDLQYMLAIRRTKIFRSAFASNVFTVVLPSISIRFGDTNKGGCIFPILSLYRTTNGGFRRTFSISHVFIPSRDKGDDETEHETASRMVPLSEIQAIERCLESFSMGEKALGTDIDCSVSYAPRGVYTGIREHSKLGKIVQSMTTDIVKVALHGEDSISTSSASSISEACHRAHAECRLISTLMQVDWHSAPGYNKPWERWLSEKTDPSFKELLFRTLFHQDYTDPVAAYASKHAADLRSMNIGNTLGIDLTGMTFFNPQNLSKTCFYRSKDEHYPAHSMIRWLAWQIFIDSALCSLRSLINRFNRISKRKADLVGVLTDLDKMFNEFIELYDLELTEYFYRAEYQNLREGLNIEADYRLLEEQFATLKDAQSLKEQRMINKLIVALTVATVTVTVSATLIQLGKISLPLFLLLAGASASLLVFLVYSVFDPIRVLSGKMVNWFLQK